MPVFNKNTAWLISRLSLPALLLGSMTTLAAVITGNLIVGATVPTLQQIRDASFPTELNISATDAERGTVSVLNAGSMTVYSNSRAGYQLRISLISPAVTGVDIEGLLPQGMVSLDSPAAVIYQPYVKGSLAPYQLSFHFRLAPGAQAGPIDWPVAVQVLPL